MTAGGTGTGELEADPGQREVYLAHLGYSQAQGLHDQRDTYSSDDGELSKCKTLSPKP